MNRREQLRARTLAEITEHAFALLDAEGAHALSLTAIAGAMGMSPPALYRYFESREALLAALVNLAYGQLADALAEADASAKTPEKRLRAVATAYRAWALEHPRRYTMILGERPDGLRDSTEGIAAISRGMDLLLDALRALVTAVPAPATGDPAPATGDPAPATALDRQLADWSRRHDRPEDPPAARRLAVLLWTRLHGLVSLEIIGVLADMGLDGALLLQAELDGVVTEATGH